MSVSRLPVLVTALALVACAPSDKTSAGDTLPRWSVGPEALRIGSIDDPDHAFGFVTGLAVDDVGRIYTTHQAEAQVRRWAVNGGAEGFVGREGGGPGEFSDVRGFGFFGDSLWARDPRANRISFFDGEGTFLGSLTPEFDLGSADSGYPLPARPELPIREGGLFGRSPAFSQAVATGELTWVPLVRMDEDGTVTDTIWRQPLSPEHHLSILRPGGGGGTYTNQPFPDGPESAFDPARGRVVVLERAAWSGSGPATFTVTALGVRGDTLWRHDQGYDPVPLPAERIDSAVSALAERLHGFMSQIESGLTIPALEGRIEESVYRPGFVPPAGELLVARDGDVWVSLAADGEPGTEWLVLDAEGRPSAHVRTPDGLRVLAADRENVWGVVTDDLDVSYIVRHPVTDPAGTT